MANKRNLRRSFLLKGLLTFTGSTLLFSKKVKANPEESETIKLIGKDGKMYEVDRRHIQKDRSEKATNSKLKNWLNLK